MGSWQIVVENILREAVEQGKFDDLAGKGKPLDLDDRNPFEDPLAPTFRRILRDNGATHPLIEARRALQAEIETLCEQLRRAWAAYRRYGSSRAWEYALETFRSNARELNRHIKLNNLRAAIPNFHVRTVDIEREIRAVCGVADHGE
jgi:DnaJ family protein C protein 28